MSAGERHVWLDGRFVAEARARIPATHGLVLQGLGAFETLRIVRGAAPLAELHGARLGTACAELGIAQPGHDWAATVRALATRNGVRNGVARITVGDGVALVTCGPLPAGLAREREQGVALQQVRCERSAPHLKGTSRIDVALAERASGGEALLAGSGGRLLETTRANLFVVQEGRLVTAPAGRVLPGIARALVLELARELGLPVRRRVPRLRDAALWREAFLTNAVRGVRPLVALDGQALAGPTGHGPTRRLQKALDQRMGL